MFGVYFFTKSICGIKEIGEEHFSLIQLFGLVAKQWLDVDVSYLRNVHEAGPSCGNQPQGLDGAVHQLGEDVTGCLCRLCAAIHLIYQQRFTVQVKK